MVNRLLKNNSVLNMNLGKRRNYQILIIRINRSNSSNLFVGYFR